MESVWQKSAPELSFGHMDGNQSTDTLIIGGGIAGILCAYKLKNAGVDCLLVEADRILRGITGCTTAKITLGHGLIYHKMIRRFGEDAAALYLDAQLKAEAEYASLCKKIKCDYEEKDSFVYSIDNRKAIVNEVEALNRLGIEAELCDRVELPFQVAGAVRVKDQAQFHPLKFLYTIAEDLPIYEHTKITELMPGRVRTNRGEIAYKHLIVATHFPILNKHGLYPVKLYQHRSYVLALRGAPAVDGMFVDESHTGLSFRSYGELMLLGGGGHRTGKKGGCWCELEDFAMRHYPKAEIVGKWATQDCMTLDGIPYIGRYSVSTPEIFVTTGFNKWGMTNAMVSADILCDIVLGKESVYSEVFSPSRSILRPQLAINLLESLLGLITPTVPRCPHMGCALKYNRAEHSWDCPCHGSRFEEDGRLINNPATDDKRM